MNRRNTRGALFSQMISENPVLFFVSRILFTISAGFLLLLVFSVLNYTQEDPNQYAVVFSLAALYIASFIGGLSVSSSPLTFYLSGLIGGALWLLLITITSFLFPEAMSIKNSPFLSVFLHLLIVIVFMMGTYVGHLILSAHRSSKRHRKRS